MKRILILLSIILFSNLAIAQSEIETLERMYNMIENDREKESKAQEIVMSYYYDTKNKIREKSDRLTQNEYDSLNTSMNMTWNQIKNAVRNNYGNSYSKFYSNKKDFLEEWREDTLEKLYKYTYN